MPSRHPPRTKPCVDGKGGFVENTTQWHGMQCPPSFLPLHPSSPSLLLLPLLSIPVRVPDRLRHPALILSSRFEHGPWGFIRRVIARSSRYRRRIFSGGFPSSPHTPPLPSAPPILLCAHGVAAAPTLHSMLFHDFQSPCYSARRRCFLSRVNSERGSIQTVFHASNTIAPLTYTTPPTQARIG
ncbi:hypothetical protein C8F04DRAFT_1129671 [Mycena alexandri]|uniref:Uncharacterized protein n=1 Tax=Mycena alexandri TaxID=1745969 RepID=A0AAD6WS56_9AGAR|nr:hypothetical protein C8F04DRAFT_1129671 [Mycena alexandri]